MELKEYSTDDLRGQIIACARQRREAYREINGFLPYSGELDLMCVAADETYSPDDRAAAIDLLATTAEERKHIVAQLPPLEINDTPTAVTVGERFVKMLEIPELGNLDLARSSHENGNWDAANVMQDQLDQLIGTLAPHFEVQTFNHSPATCTMYVSVFAPEFLQAGLVCLTRNSQKATMYNNDDIYINKRSEFVIDINKMGLHLGSYIKQRIKRHISENSFMVDDDFDLFNGLVVDRHVSLLPIYSTLYAYREKVPRFKELPQPPILNRFPALKEAWEEHHRPKQPLILQ